MPRCIVCDEWAGPHRDLHEECLLDLQRQMQRPSRMTHWFRKTLCAARALVAAISSSSVRAI